MSDAINIIELIHQKAHAASTNPEDYLFVSITQQEMLLLLMGLVMGAIYYPCLENPMLDLERKVSGAIKAQKPTWHDDVEANG